MNRWITCAVFSGWMCAAGCGGEDRTANAPPPPAPPPPSSETTMENTAKPPPAPTPAPIAPMPPMAPTEGAHGGGLTDPPSTPAEVSQPAALTDDQILFVLHTANMGEIDQAKLAQQKAKNARVKQYAAMMIKDHSEADKKGAEVTRKINASPASNDVSKNLESESKQLTAAMSSEKGSDFDKSYIDAQIKEHKAVLDLIDNNLAQNAKSSEMKAMLKALRSKIEGHLKQAQDIQKAL